MDLREMRRVGRSLVATKIFRPGDVVLEDTPVITWDGSQAPALPSSAATVAGVPGYLVAAMAAYCRTAEGSPEREAIDDMCAPDVPLCAATWDLFECAAAVAAAFSDDHSTQSSAGLCSAQLPADRRALTVKIARAAMAAKVNAHRGPDGQWRLFRLASKLAHSCDPNTMYLPDRGAFVAVRHILPGTLVTFSYVGGPLLLASASVRQSRLLKSHLFVCQCHRCRGDDLSRKMRCPGWQGARGCGGTLVRRGSHLLELDDDSSGDGCGRVPLWRCTGGAGHTCGWTGRDADLAAVGLLGTEGTLEDTAASWMAGTRKCKLSELASVVREGVAVLGPLHWTVAAAAFQLAQYCRAFGKLAKLAPGASSRTDADGRPQHVLLAHLSAAFTILLLMALEDGPKAVVFGGDGCEGENCSKGSDAMRYEPEVRTPPHMLAAQAMIQLIQDTHDMSPYGTVTVISPPTEEDVELTRGAIPAATGPSLVQQLAAVLAPLLGALYGEHDKRSMLIRGLSAAGRLRHGGGGGVALRELAEGCLTPESVRVAYANGGIGPALLEATRLSEQVFASSSPPEDR